MPTFRRLPVWLLAASVLSACNGSPSVQNTRPETATALHQAASAESIADNPYYTRNTDHPFIDVISIVMIYLDADLNAANDARIMEKAEAKRQELLNEYRQTGKIRIGSPDYSNPAALAEFRIRLSAQADLGHSIFEIGKAGFKTDGNGQVITAERDDIQENSGLIHVKYSYWNGQPFSVSLQYGPQAGGGQSGMQTFLYVNQKWMPMHPDAQPPAGYRDCAVCTEEAYALYQYKDTLAKEGPAADRADKYETAAARRNIGVIDKRDLPELMLEGATRNSLTLGYDRHGRPEKLYYSFGDSRRLHSYEFYFLNGKPFSGKSSTIFYHPDGSIDTDHPNAAQARFEFDDKGRFQTTDPGDPPPERPLTAENWQQEIQNMISIAEKHR